MKKILKNALAFGLLLAGVTGLADEFQPPAREITPGLQLFDKPVSKSRWLWFQAPQVAGFADAFYRCTLTLDEEVESCWILTALDDKGEVYFNGSKLDQAPFKQPDMQVRFHYYTPQNWRKGKNVIAMVAHNNGAMGGMIMRGAVKLKSGKVIKLFSTPDFWKASGTRSPDWAKIDFDDSAWQKAMILGDARMEPWSSVSNVIKYMLDDSERAAYETVINKSFNVDFLNNAPDWKARVVWNGDRAGLELNGKVEPPMTFVLGFNPWIVNTSDDIVKAGKSGIKFVEYLTSSNRCFVAPGEYDFTVLDNDIKRILTLNPNAAVIVAFRVDLQGKWVSDNPDELIGYANGPTDGKGGQLGRFRAASMASEVFRKEIENFIASAVKYMQQKDYYKRIVGVRIGYGVFGEWHYYGMKLEMPDTGKAMTREFRKFLRQRYRSNAELQAAWHDKNVTFDTAAVPNKAERIGKERFFRDPSSADRKVLDYYECHGNVNADTLLRFAKAAKTADPRLLVGAYYGYFFCMGYPAEGQTLMMDKVLASPYIDYLSSPNSYDIASRHAGGDGLPRMLTSIFRRYKKLAIIEVDIHTHKTRGRDVYRVGPTAKHSEAVFQRDIALGWLNGCGVQFLEFDARRGYDSWFNDPLIYKSWHDGLNIWKKLPPAEVSHKDAVVVVSPVEMYRHGYPNGLLQRPVMESILDKTMHALHQSGYTFDVVSLNDYLAEKAERKLVIFLNIFSPTQAERAALKAKLRKPGVTAVWSMAPGLVTENGYSNEAMSDLTGIKLQYNPEKLPYATALHDWVTMKSVSGKNELKEKYRVHCIDKNVEVWGRYITGRQPALVCKKLSDGSTAYFAGMPVILPEVWAAIFQRSNIHRFSNVNVMTAGNEKLLLVHVGKAGAYPVYLPRKAKKVTELFSNKVLGTDCSELILRSNTAATWFLKIEY